MHITTYWLHRTLQLYHVVTVACISDVWIVFSSSNSFVFQNNFQCHLDKTFSSEHISCRHAVSTSQLLLTTGRSSGVPHMIGTEGT